MDSFQGISQRYFLDFKWFYMTILNSKNAFFPELAASVCLNKGSLNKENQK